MKRAAELRFFLAVLLLLLQSCSILVSLYVANLSSHPIHLEFTVPCTPYCPSPRFISVPQLRHGAAQADTSRPPAVVQKRVDSLVTFSLELPPDSAVRLFGVGADGAGSILYPAEQFRGIRIVVDTGMEARTYAGAALKGAFKKWRRTRYVLEVP